MGAARSLAVNRDNVGFGLAQPVDPGGEGGGEQIAVQRIHHVVQRVMRGDAAFERQHPAQEPQLFQAPEPRLDKVFGPGEGRTQDQKHDFRQWIQHLAKLAGVIKGRKMVQKRGVAHRETSSLRGPK